MRLSPPRYPAFTISFTRGFGGYTGGITDFTRNLAGAGTGKTRLYFSIVCFKRVAENQACPVCYQIDIQRFTLGA